MRQAATVALGVSTAIAGMCTAFCVFGAVVTPIAIALEPAQPDDPPAWFGAVFYGGWALLQGVCCAVQARGTLAMHRADSLPWAWAGVVAALVGGMSCCNGYNLAAGIFGIVVLADATVQQDFVGQAP